MRHKSLCVRLLAGVGILIIYEIHFGAHQLGRQIWQIHPIFSNCHGKNCTDPSYNLQQNRILQNGTQHLPHHPPLLLVTLWQGRHETWMEYSMRDATDPIIFSTHQNTGKQEYWDTGKLEYETTGIFEYWNTGIFEHWKQPNKSEMSVYFVSIIFCTHQYIRQRGPNNQF